jgi:hypothetical protein
MRPLPFDLGELAAAIEMDASDLFGRCVELNGIIEQAIEQWNPFADEGDEDAYLDPGAEMIPYDALPDLEDLARRVAGLGVRLAVASALLSRERRVDVKTSPKSTWSIT